MELLIEIVFWLAIIAGFFGFAWVTFIGTVWYIKLKAEAYVADKTKDVAVHWYDKFKAFRKEKK